jgi:small basic protein (TIGR04137 family)
MLIALEVLVEIPYTSGFATGQHFRSIRGDVNAPYTGVLVEMTIDKSLKVRRGLIRSRSVLTRAERLAKLSEVDRWKEGDRVLGLPKVRVAKLALRKKKKTKKEDEEADEKAPGTK